VEPEQILLLHPGAMGSSLGAALVTAGHRVSWVRQERSGATRERAAAAGLVTKKTLEEGLEEARHVVSVCPPGAALTVARAVRGLGFGGIYVDANAISPASAGQIEEFFGAGFVDGGIIGPPAKTAGSTRLYLSGPNAGRVAAWFEGTRVEAVSVSCSASALKMCFAAFTKGSAALLLAVRALAEREGVAAALLSEWERSQPGLARRFEATARGTAGKAWRFEDEMREIAETFSDAGLPPGFHEAAADVFARLSDLKNRDPGEIDPGEVLRAIAAKPKT